MKLTGENLLLKLRETENLGKSDQARVATWRREMMVVKGLISWNFMKQYQMLKTIRGLMKLQARIK